MSNRCRTSNEKKAFFFILIHCVYGFRMSNSELLSKVRLSDILENKKMTAAFKQFLETEYSDGNLEFWTKCESFKEMPDEKRGQEARSIFNKYLLSTSMHQVTNQDINKLLQ